MHGWPSCLLTRYPDVGRFSALGKMLGADYVLTGTCSVSVSESEIKHDERNKDDGSFYGCVYEYVRAKTEVSVKLIDVNSTAINYSNTFRGDDRGRDRRECYTDKTRWRNDIESRRRARQIKDIFRMFSSMPEAYTEHISDSINKTVDRLYEDVRRKFPHEGQIMDIVSPTEVRINLGSAYGAKPGDKIVVWSDMAPFYDPKTGLTTRPKRRKAELKITEVTSGITAIAGGSAKEISSLVRGDKKTLQP